MILDQRNKPRRFWITASCITGVALQGCVTTDSSIKPVPFTEPMKIAKIHTESDIQEAVNGHEAAAGRDRLTTAPGPVPPLAKTASEPIAASNAPPLTGEPISINFDGIRLPAFVNTVFGELLKVTFEIDSSVTQKDQLITLRTAEPLPPAKFLQLVEEVLGNYGISVVYSNGVYRIVESTSVKQSIPRIVRTRALSSIPADMRPIFYFQPLGSVSTVTMSLWLQVALKDRVQAIVVPNFNGLLLLGNSADVASALEVMQTLDQPYMAGFKSLEISPAFWSAQKLAQQLIEIMSAEGYSIGIGAGNPTAVRLVPIEALNVIIVFGSGEDSLEHTKKWATELDQPGQKIGSEGVFYHQVYNAKAKDLADIVKGLLDQGSGLAPSNDQKSSGQTSAPAGKQRIVVDEPRNGLIFLGSAEEYAQFKSLVDQMDHAPLEVMIEATVAEVTLNKSQNLGVTLGFDSGATNVPNRTTATSDSTGIFYSIIRSKGQITAQLNALASNNKVQVLSSPRLVTSSGKSAAISVGTDVPIITAQETAPNATVAGTSSLLQSIQYRSTGIILNITPTINSNRRVELTVSQEVSSATANTTSSVSSPTILRRSIQTALSLDDGQTVLLGGLISETYNDGNNGVPYLKDIPVIGNLFKNQSKSIDRTELIVLLTPYIIDSPGAADQVRDSFRSQLSDWATPQKPKPKP